MAKAPSYCAGVFVDNARSELKLNPPKNPKIANTLEFTRPIANCLTTPNLTLLTEHSFSSQRYRFIFTRPRYPQPQWLAARRDFRAGTRPRRRYVW